MTKTAALRRIDISILAAKFHIPAKQAGHEHASCQLALVPLLLGDVMPHVVASAATNCPAMLTLFGIT